MLLGKAGGTRQVVQAYDVDPHCIGSSAAASAARTRIDHPEKAVIAVSAPVPAVAPVEIA